MKNISDKLQEAIDTGEVLRVKYHGGSQPGSVREISPIRILGDKLWARCFTSHAVKAFIIEKIELCDAEMPNDILWDPSLIKVNRYNLLKDVHKENLSALQAMGWHICLTNDCLSLHRRSKNGKPLKGSDVSLDFEEYTHDLVFYDEDDIRDENRRKRQRPWVVRAKNMETITYGNLDKAAELFMQQAKHLAPNLN